MRTVNMPLQIHHNLPKAMRDLSPYMAKEGEAGIVAVGSDLHANDPSVPDIIEMMYFFFLIHDRSGNYSKVSLSDDAAVKTIQECGFAAELFMLATDLEFRKLLSSPLEGLYGGGNSNPDQEESIQDPYSDNTDSNWQLSFFTDGKSLVAWNSEVKLQQNLEWYINNLELDYDDEHNDHTLLSPYDLTAMIIPKFNTAHEFTAGWPKISKMIDITNAIALDSSKDISLTFDKEMLLKSMDQGNSF